MSKIKEKRLAKGMSRAEFARQTGIPLRTLEDWEADKYPPSDIKRMLKISEILQCKIEDLI